METHCAPAPAWPRIENSSCTVEDWFDRLVQRHADCEEASPGELREIAVVITCLGRLVTTRYKIDGWKLKLVERAEKAAAAKRETPAATKTTITLAPDVYAHVKKKIEEDQAKTRLRDSEDDATLATRNGGGDDDGAGNLE